MNIYCVKSCDPFMLYELKPSEFFNEVMETPRLFLTDVNACKEAKNECQDLLNDPDFAEDYTMKITHLKNGDIEYTVAEKGCHEDPILLVRISCVPAK